MAVASYTFVIDLIADGDFCAAALDMAVEDMTPMMLLDCQSVAAADPENDWILPVEET